MCNPLAAPHRSGETWKSSPEWPSARVDSRPVQWPAVAIGRCNTGVAPWRGPAPSRTRSGAGLGRSVRALRIDGGSAGRASAGSAAARVPSPSVRFVGAPGRRDLEHRAVHGPRVIAVPGQARPGMAARRAERPVTMARCSGSSRPWTVIVPVKSSARAKSRIRLDPAMRRALALIMAEDTVSSVTSAGPVGRTLVVVEDPRDGASLARMPGVEVFVTHTDELNAAIRDGLAGARSRRDRSGRGAAGRSPLADPGRAERRAGAGRPASAQRGAPTGRAPGTTLLTARTPDLLHPAVRSRFVPGACGRRSRPAGHPRTQWAAARRRPGGQPAVGDRPADPGHSQVAALAAAGESGARPADLGASGRPQCAFGPVRSSGTVKGWTVASCGPAGSPGTSWCSRRP